MIDTQYTRITPRDFFNESKLLKCFGRLALAILNNEAPEGLTISENGEPFTIGLTNCGNLAITNVQTAYNNTPLMFMSTYNSKSSYPFIVSFDYCEYTVFDDGGNFTDEFLEFINELDLVEV